LKNLAYVLRVPDWRIVNAGSFWVSPDFSNRQRVNIHFVTLINMILHSCNTCYTATQNSSDNVSFNRLGSHYSLLTKYCRSEWSKMVWSCGLFLSVLCHGWLSITKGIHPACKKLCCSNFKVFFGDRHPAAMVKRLYVFRDVKLLGGIAMWLASRTWMQLKFIDGIYHVWANPLT